MNDTSAAKGNILIVDDQPVHLKVLSVMLTRQGYHVRPAISGQVALRAIRKAPPDLILLDIMMPDMGGFEICRTLKADEETRDIPVIFVSALNEIQDKVRAFEVGGVDYITKPFQIEEVLVRVNTHITLQSMRGRLERKNSELEQEIEKHKKTQQWLVQLRHQLKLVLDSAGEGIFGLDARGRHTFVNTSAASMLGYRIEELIGQISHPLWHHSRADGTPLPEDNCPIVMTIRDGIVRRGDDEMFWRKDGTGFWAEYVCTPIRENGEIVGAVVVFSDVTERKQAEEALRKLSRAVEQSASPIIITNLEGVIEFVNPAFTEVTGYSFDEAVGQNSNILKSGEHSPDFYKHLWETISSGQVWEGELKNRKKDGTLYWEKATISPVKDKGGQTTHYLAIKENITERKQMEAALKQERASLAQRVAEQTVELRAANAELSHALRVKGEFLANMSHELRTPLNAILGMAEILKDEVYGPLNEPQLNSVRLINESGQHLLDLINDILDISKIEAGKLTLIRSPVPVDNACQASLRFVQQAAHKKQIEILTNIETAVESITVDERRLKQILVNLLSNAVKFTPNRGKIGLDVTTDPAREIIRFKVWDTGIGIPESEMKRLFKPFVQVDSSLTRQHEGTGLGLSLVYRLTDMHGGSVTVRSTVDQGTTFTVALPVHLPEAVHPNQNQVGAKNHHSQPAVVEPDENTAFAASPNNPDAHLVLLAEDNEMVSFWLKHYLGQNGCRVAVARSGVEAIEQAKAKKPDLIIMDIQMPVLDGLEAIRQIRSDQKLPRMFIVAATALSTPGDRDRCLQAGADQYLTKPIGREQLAQTIQQFLQFDPQRASP